MSPSARDLPPLRDNVTAIVVAYDSAEVLPACLEALAGEGVPAIVVDNASSDVTSQIAAARGATVVANARNEGYGRANNIGVAASATPFVLIVNPDLVVEPGAVAALLAAAELYPDAGMLAPRVVEPSGRVFVQPRSLLSPAYLNQAKAAVIPEGDACLPFLSGACLLVRRELFLALGGFDPAIFLFYEDDDLCRRMRDAGHALVHVHDAQVRHARGRSSRPDPARRFRARWHLAWSHGYVAAKYGLPVPSPWTILENGAKAVGYGLILNRDKMSAHAGSVAGALAWRRGVTALEQQGLAGKPELSA
ncbi:glycosyltransferase [Bosea caraganae]|uniref:Glycosyltransferase n=1 Tax=Bosea caraganae TaxID=2763117 RepID=A0A370L305_9HYPH|nr:glycosyltransferase family 2 protein [Bosea caraganae]RDJ21548.1 glycosyltransferase [Bosea caraganae]RDJ23544.1 glycosyltransferase [Bosea caraganae]